jgi:hypothetical protein
MFLLTTLCQPKCAYCTSSQDFYTITLFLFIYSIQINNEKKRLVWLTDTRTTDTQWRHKSQKSENLGRFGRQNMLGPYLKIWDWDLIFGRTVKAVSSLGVRSLWTDTFRTIWLASITQGSNSSNNDPISIELENLWWIKTLTRLLRLSFNNREDF